MSHSTRKRVTSSPVAAALMLGSIALLAAPREAEAQDLPLNGGNPGGADTHLFRSAVDSKGFFSINGSDVVGAGDLSFGLVLDYGYGIMPIANTDAEPPPHGRGSYMLDHSFQGTLQFNYGIANMLVVGISAPVVLAGHDTLDDIGPTGATYSSRSTFAQNLSNIALHAKLRLIRPDDGPSVGLAAIVQGGVEVGGSEDLISEPGGFVWPQAAFEARIGQRGIWRVGVNAGFRAHFGDNAQFGLNSTTGAPQLENGAFEYGQLVTTGLGTSLRVLEPLDLVAETYQSILVTGDSDSQQKISSEVIGGIKLFLDGKSFLMIGGGAGYLPGFQSATARGVIGFVFEPSIGDRDGDGIKDDEDDCPDQPEDFDGFEDTRADSPEGQYGCPDPDNDGDGILDVDDACPNNPEDMDGDEDQDGCPESRDGDRDGDGILDSRDKCPDDPEDKDGFEDKDGCPDPDNDKDGIPDVTDACPNTPGVADPDPTKNGCPAAPEPPKKVIISENEILILEKVQFATGSAKILPESFGIIDDVAQTLKENGQFTLIEVQGHADRRAGAAYNLNLTKQRAASVVKALEERGVTKSRIRSQGYGFYCPLDPEQTPEAWEKNRRVEFKIVRTQDGPTGVELGCDEAASQGVRPLPP